MKISENFTSKEWLDADVLRFCRARGYSPTWYINPNLVKLAEFYKAFFFAYFHKLDNNVIDVLIIINKPGVGGRGLRSPMYRGKGASMSQHKFLQAFDCDVVLKYPKGITKEADYKLIHDIILEYDVEFMEAGLTTIEHYKKAPTWLHSDIRWIPNQKTLKIV